MFHGLGFLFNTSDFLRRALRRVLFLMKNNNWFLMYTVGVNHQRHSTDRSVMSGFMHLTLLRFFDT